MTLVSADQRALRGTIDRASRVPLYYQLEQFVIRDIEGGYLRPNDPIPTERELEERFGVSRATVRQAIAELIASGYLYRRRGKGTFVAPPRLEDTSRLGMFLEELRQQGLHVETEVLQFHRTAPTDRAARFLNLPEGSTVYVASKRVMADGEPVAVTWGCFNFPPHVILTADDVRMHDTIYAVLESRYGIIVARAEKAIQAVAATPSEALALDVEDGSPLLLSETVAYTTSGDAIDFVRTFYRGDRYTYRTVVVR